MDEFHTLLSTSRSGFNLLQGDIARTLGIGQAAISSWEHGRSLPSIDKLPQIADAYRLELEVLTSAFIETRRIRDSIKEVRRSMNQRSPRR